MNRKQRLEKQKEFLIKAAYWLVWGTAAVLLIKYAGPVLIPFLAAFAIAWALSVPVNYITEKSNIKRNIVAVLAVVILYALVGAVLYFTGSHLVGLVKDTFAQLTVFLTDTVFPLLRKFCFWMDGISRGVNPAAGAARGLGAESTEMIERAGELVSGMSGTVISGVSNIAAEIPAICMKVLIAVIATLFMELEFPDILRFLKNQIPPKYGRMVQEGKTYVTGTLGKCILSYALILFLTFAELTIGLMLLKIKGAVVIAFIIAALDILPVLGTGTILVPWAVVSIATGDLKTGIGILILYTVITVIRNIVEPRLVGRQIGLSPVVMLPCMLLGLRFFGIIGLFAVPFGVAFLKSLNDRGIIHIFNMGEEEESHS